MSTIYAKNADGNETSLDKICILAGHNWPKLRSWIVPINYTNLQISEIPKKSNMQDFL